MALKGHEGTGIQEFSRPSGICCDDDGRVVVADSKNQRVMIFSPLLDFLWAVSYIILLLVKVLLHLVNYISLFMLTDSELILFNLREKALAKSREYECLSLWHYFCGDL